MRTCKHCGQPIIGRRRDAVYCSVRCNRRACEWRVSRRAGRPRDHVTRFCAVCGAEFVSRRFSQVYCGRACKTFALNARRIDKQRKTDSEPRVSPALILRRTKAIREKWTLREIRARRTSNAPESA